MLSVQRDPNMNACEKKIFVDSRSGITKVMGQ